ncbi:cysteinyl-tRNA synthetase [Umbelopsis sp. WA50703]
MMTGSPNSSNASIPLFSSGTSTPTLAPSNPRKRSDGSSSDMHHSNISSYTASDEPYFTPQWGHHFYAIPAKRYQTPYNKKRPDKSESISLRDGKETELDQNFDSMEGIVNTEYHSNEGSQASLHPDSIFSSVYNSDTEAWMPPDSWAVQPAPTGSTRFPGTVTPVEAYDKEPEDEEGFSTVDHEKWEHSRKNYCIRIFRPDGTFTTLQVPLNTQASELVTKLAGKFFLPDISKYGLRMRRHKLERILAPNERPLQIQKQLLEQIGYTDQDRVEDVGREDNSYLVRFTFGPIVAPTLQEEDLDFGNYQHVDLQACNLPAIPIFLYRHAARIESLDVSKNLLIELPIDFVQMCTSLRQLRLANNEYAAMPPSVRYIRSLEQLNISGNRLRDLQHAQLDQLENLTSLTAFNNNLDCLPQYFANFSHLTSLNISNNSFTTFPEVICSITTLVELDISFNKLTDFPPEIGSLVNLVRLLAIANQLTGQLPQNFRHLASLKELDIRQNLITDLEVLTYLPSLEILFVDYNAVSIVNSEFKNLRQLKMCKNHLTQFNLSPLPTNVSEDIYGVPRQIEGFPGMTGALLTELNISSCKLSSLSEDMFANVTAIETLVLDNNTLNSLPSSIGELRMLSKLSVQNNLLSSIPVEIAKLGQLKTLDVQKNNLKTLPKEIWLCSALQNLNCSSNLLETFPEPYSAPGVALHVALGPQAQAVVTPTVMANAASDVQQNTALGSNAGQGMVPTQNATMSHLMNSSPSSSQSQPHDITGMSASTDYLPRTDSLPGNASPETRPNSLTSGQSGTPHAPPNFNPPSFFASPRNHPPPLSLSLRKLFLGDNRLTDDVWSPLSLFLELRTLNLSFNDLYDIPSEGLCHQHLYELYLSGNQLASLPADDIEKLSYLRVLSVNGNKLQTLPAEIGKLRKLLVLDVGSNVLKYNIANLEYDWNWNWNLGLKYLNLSGNKRLEIKVHKDLSDFSALSRLRVLGLMDVTILVSVPEETHDRRIRTSPSEVNSMAYGIADWLGPNDHLATWDLVMPRFRMRDDECLFGLYDGRKTTKSGCKITKYLNDAFTIHFTSELKKVKDDDTVVAALRRTFLSLEKELGSTVVDDKSLGASAVVCYISGTKLYVANVGDALAVISRNNGQAYEITQKHIPLNPSEISRIRAAGGYVSNSDALNGELNVSRSFGHFRLIPVVNANPYISTIDLTEEDEFVIMASKGLWERMPYQSAVDIARTEREDLMLAAQKLRDFAITYGADDNIMVMVIGVGDMFDKRDKRYRTQRGGTLPVGRAGSSTDAGILMDDGTTTPGPLALMGKSKRRGKEDGPGDSTLARLEREVPPPINQVALVFTDIKNSTLLWETQPEGMRSAIKIHDSVMRRTLRSVGGYEVKTEGDAFMVCFQNITSALLWCFTVQLQLLEADWPAGILDTEDGREIEKDGVVIYKGLSVRMGIHWGSPVFERNPITNRMDYFGPVVNKAGRICTAADGGQICVSSDVIAALRSFPGVLEGDDSPSTDPAHNGDDLTSVMAGSGRSISKDIVQLRRLGFHVMELGERRLKGLETPEILSMVYPKQLAARMELDKMELLSHGGVVPPPNITPPPLMATPGVSTAHMTNSPFGEQPPETAKPSVAFSRLLESNHIQSLVRIALRLEGVASGNILQPTFHNSLLEVNNTVGASDEQILHLVENLVTRVENAASMMYLQKMGRFTSVLEKLGEAIEVDPSHILRALQMYADVIGASEPPNGKKENYDR